MDLGKTLVKLRKDHGLTQEDLAEKYHITRQTISNWENGKSSPDLETLIKISDDFGITLDSMLKDDAQAVKVISNEQRHGRHFKLKILLALLLGVVIISSGLYILYHTSSRLSPDDYNVEIKLITLDNVKLDEVNKVAVYRDVEGGDYLIEDDSGDDGVLYFAPEDGVYVFKNEQYASLMQYGQAYEIVVSSKKGIDFLSASRTNDSNVIIEVRRSNFPFFGSIKNTRTLTVIFEPFDYIYDINYMKTKNNETNLVWKSIYLLTLVFLPKNILRVNY